ncbi:hypothetical protein, partial [Polaromonas sp.]|uniref:hypothetical protein n=1 Tax=Polaromonas sp. TaxID=1869339 RepID=UPI003BB717EC
RCSQLGQTSAGTQANHVPLRLGGLQEALQAQVALAPEQTLTQLCSWAREAHGVKVGATTMHKTLARFGLTLKKDPARQRAAAKRRRAGAHTRGAVGCHR